MKENYLLRQNGFTAVLEDHAASFDNSFHRWCSELVDSKTIGVYEGNQATFYWVPAIMSEAANKSLDFTLASTPQLEQYIGMDASLNEGLVAFIFNESFQDKATTE
jgi:hypothetical protein